MSIELAVFDRTEPISDRDALKICISACEASTTPRSDGMSQKIEAFLKGLRRTYPCPNSVPTDNRGDSPWAAAHTIADDVVVCSLAPSQYEGVATVIVELAQECDLFCFDPMSGRILVAPDGLHKKSWWKF